jgi:hypothetical protein
MEIETLVEKNVNSMLDKIFGDKDDTLKAITKLSILNDGSEEMKNKINQTIALIRRNNELEKQMLDDELNLTYDSSGNIIEIYDIKDGEEKTNFTS